MDKNKKNINGFTILEVIIAVFILSMVVFGSYILAQQTMAAVALSKSRLAAYYLAQEKIEEIKNIRDNNWLNDPTDSESWKNGIVGMHGNIEDNLGEGFERFTRTVWVFSLNETIDGESYDYLDISAIVSWSERGNNYSVEVVNRLYNWYFYY